MFPYIMVYMRQLGLSPTVSSTIFGFTEVVTSAIPPCFGLLADKVKSHKRVLMLCSILASISFGCLLIVPATNQHKEQMKEDKIRLVCGIKNTSQEFCGGQQCEKFNMFQIDNHTTITCLFTFEFGDASSNTCMYATGPRNVLQCLDTNNNSDSYYLSIELDSRQLTEMKLDRATCGF